MKYNIFYYITKNKVFLYLERSAYYYYLYEYLKTLLVM